MPRLRVSHRTELRYPAPVTESVNHVRLLPADSDLQRVVEAELLVFPETAVSHYDDAYGNRVAWFQLHQPHTRLVIEARSAVEVRAAARRTEGALAATSWDDLDDPAYRDHHAEFLAPSELVRRGAPIERFAAELGVEAATPGMWLVALEMAVAGAIAYAPGFTRADTPIERAIEIRRGVCQDLAQIFIALARRQGVPTRYVSGWLFQPNAHGPGESHAWVQSHLPGTGWIQFDPTHPDPDLRHYVRVGVGRDYADVPPIRGTYVGPAATSMDVEVHVDEETPAGGRA